MTSLLKGPKCGFCWQVFPWVAGCQAESVPAPSCLLLLTIAHSEKKWKTEPSSLEPDSPQAPSPLLEKTDGALCLERI